MRYCSFVVVILCFLFASPVIANVGLWQSWSASSDSINDLVTLQKRGFTDDSLLQLDHEQMKLELQQAVEQYPFYTIALPLPDASFIQVSVQETQVLSDALQQQFPNVRTYKISHQEQPAFSGRIELSPQGLHAMLQTATGETIYIDFINTHDVSVANNHVYRSYWAENLRHAKRTDTDTHPHQCALAHNHAEHDDIHSDNNTHGKLLKQIDALAASAKLSQQSDLLGDTAVHKYRLAVSATGEYTAQHGGTKASALAAIASTINRINHIYERDVAIHFELVANNDQLIFTDASTDPFSGNVNTFLQQNQILINNIIGHDQYDIGHLFTASGGGVALVGGACRANVKAMGVSGHQLGERFDLAFVAHEIGHQFGATHTFSGTSGLCLAANRVATTAYEPGSGSTIMSYAGICGNDNVQENIEPLFHIGSIQQIRAYKQNQLNTGCGEVLRNTNNVPIIDAGADYVIPTNTPFALTGTVIAADESALVYNWQQVDSGTASTVDIDKGDNALFRTFLPSESKQRVFPQMEVLLGAKSALGETLPTRNRIMNFQFVVQDSQGVTVHDAMQIRAHKDAQQFALAMPNAVYQQGVESNVVWEVANTHLSPVSCAAVDIALSVDNGQNFDHLLASGVANNGLATVVIPTTVPSVQTARFRVSCSDNIFFAVSKRSFAIDVNAEPEALTRSNNISVNENDVLQSVSSGGGGGGSSILFLLSIGIAFLIKFGRKS